MAYGSLKLYAGLAAGRDIAKLEPGSSASDYELILGVCLFFWLLVPDRLDILQASGTHVGGVR